MASRNGVLEAWLGFLTLDSIGPDSLTDSVKLIAPIIHSHYDDDVKIMER